MEKWVYIKNYTNYKISTYGRILNTVTNKYRKISINSHGYLSLILCQNNIEKTYLHHRLMAEAFIPNIYNKPFVNHIDGNKQNNNLDNLEWVTESENSIHAYKKGLIKILKGVEIYYAGGLYENIGNHFNVSKSTIFDIKTKQFC